jgi:hypothetical protein
MEKNKHYHGSCFCGAVQFDLTAEPEVMAYCHCDSCRHWSASPVSAFTLWRPDAIEVTRGSEHIGVFDRNPGSDETSVVSERKWCRLCGGHLFTNHPGMGMVDVPAAVIEGLDFEPGFHVHYQESVQPIADGLSKFRDLPAEAGGSGVTLPEQRETGGAPANPAATAGARSTG